MLDVHQRFVVHGQHRRAIGRAAARVIRHGVAGSEGVAGGEELRGDDLPVRLIVFCGCGRRVSHEGGERQAGFSGVV